MFNQNKISKKGGTIFGQNEHFLFRQVYLPILPLCIIRFRAVGTYIVLVTNEIKKKLVGLVDSFARWVASIDTKIKIVF